MQGGKVWFESKKNEGTTFFVELPFEIGVEDVNTDEASNDISGEKFLQGKKVLLVEDDKLNQIVAQHILEEELGATIDIANNGRIALEMVQTNQYDMVIMDIQMPEMDGYTATGEIRKLPAGAGKVPIIALTAHAFKEEEKKCKDAGMNGFISKPIKVEELKKQLKRVL